jgi:hypothetical protein
MSSCGTRKRATKLAPSVGLASCLVIGMIAIAGATGGSAGAAVKPAHSISIGTKACGHVNISPSTNLRGGETLTLKTDWLGTPSNSQCPVTPADCPDFFGSCNAGFWVAGLFCSTLAATDIATGQSDCDLNNIVVLSDYNSGPNNAPDYHGTSYNQCTTLKTIGSIFGGLPGTLNCATDGAGINGWTETWKLGHPRGTGYGPVEETGTTTPFRPGTAGVDCPPSAANIAEGAIPGYCAFVVLPIEFQYYCVFDICLPNTSDPNDGATENTNDSIATLLQYANAPAGPRQGTRTP